METNKSDMAAKVKKAPPVPRKPKTDAFLRACPSREALEMLADKWTLLAICALSDGPMRFGELRRRLDGVTQKMLTQTLRPLERDGMVTRTVFATTPPAVEYELTRLGESALAFADSLRGWAERHVWQVMQARERFDSRPSAAQPRGMRGGIQVGRSARG